MILPPSRAPRNQLATRVFSLVVFRPRLTGSWLLGDASSLLAIQVFGGVATKIIVVPYADRVWVTLTQLPTFGTLVGSQADLLTTRRPPCLRDHAATFPTLFYISGAAHKQSATCSGVSPPCLQISVSAEDYPDGMRFFNARTLLGRRDDDEMMTALARRLAEEI